MFMEEVEKIAKHFPENTEIIQLSPIKELFPDASYGKLKMILAWMQKTHGHSIL